MDFIIKLSIGLAVTWLFYWLMLRRLTFYRWNRLFLLVYPAMAFLVPFIDITDLLHHRENGAWLNVIPVLEHYSFRTERAGDLSWFTPVHIGMLVLAAGSIIMLARFCWQYWSLRKAVSGAVLLADDEARLYHVNKRIVPFSFGRSIYLNKDLHTEAELREILHHEFIHVKQRHSLDMFWGELLCIINWYNPFAWLLRNAIRQNLEFIADHQVLANGIDRKQYQYMLLKVTGMASFSVANNFNLSSLKKRIIMMNKKTSASVHLLRFMLIVPVLAVLLLAFRSVTRTDLPAPPGLISEKMSGDTSRNNELMLVLESNDTIRLAAAAIRVDTVPKVKELKRDSIGNIHVYKKDGTHSVFIRKTDGSTEKYDLTDPKQKEAFEKKYGKLKTPAPPSPPLAPPAPARAPKGGAVPPPPPPPPAPVEMIVDTAYTVNEGSGVVERKAVLPPRTKVEGVKGGTGKVIEVRRDRSLSDKTVTVVGYGKESENPVEIKAIARVNGKEPLVVLDGKIVPYSEVENIPPGSISHISILKDKAAVAIYGEKAKDGVIVVTTKGAMEIRANKNGDLVDNLCNLNALIFIDGKKFECQEAQALLKDKPERIASVDVYKGADAVKKATGEDAQNAIIIKTKQITD